MAKQAGRTARLPRRGAGPAPGETGNERLPRWMLPAGLAALALVAYANAFANGFVWDDPIILTRQLPAFRSIGDLLFTPRNIPQFSPDYYRPLVVATYLLDRWAGGGSPVWFHFTVVLAHALTTVAVFFLGLALFEPRAGEPGGGAGITAAAVGAAIFALHPVHTEAVAWVAGRADVMATLFGVTAVLAHRRSRRSIGWAAVAGIAALLALLAKEVAIALVVIIPSLDLLLPGGAQGSRAAPAAVARAERRRRSESDSPRGPVLSLAVRYIPLAVAFAAYAGLRVASIGIGLHGGSAGMGLPPASQVLAALGMYLRKLVMPLPLNAYIASLPHGAFFLAAAALAVAALALVGGVAARRRDGATAALVVWVFAGIAPALAVLVKLPEVPVAERYLYFPSVGFCLLGGELVVAALSRCPNRARWLLVAAVTALLVAAAVVTTGRNRVWRSDQALWSDTVDKSPEAGLPFRSLAVVAQNAGRTKEAEVLYRQALGKRNNDAGRITVYNNLGSMALTSGDLDTAERYYRQALAIHPLPDCLFNLGVIALTRARDAGQRGDATAKREESEEALSLLERAETQSPYDSDIQAGLGQGLDFLGREAEARQHYQRALDLGVRRESAEQIRKRLAAPVGPLSKP